MTAKLVINLLGSPSILLNQVPLDVQTYKATALLAYLAVNQGHHSRSELATLLWTESDKNKALAALRTTLWKLKRAGLEEILRVQHSTVFLDIAGDVEVDVSRFHRLISLCETHGHHPSKVCPACLPLLAEAAKLYRGDFMKGFGLRDAAEFDSWQSLQDQVLRLEIRQVLEKLVNGHRAQGELEPAIQFARQWLAYDRFNGQIHRQLMTLYTDAGLRTEAIQLYRELTRLMQRDATEIEPETTQLYHRILSEKPERILSTQLLDVPVILAVDIDNSDQMWSNYHEQMIRTVSRYQAIIKECANQYGAQVINQNRDSTLLIFDRGQPLHCVLSIHKRLLRTTWTIDAIPRLRIALSAAEQPRNNMEEYDTDIYQTQGLLSTAWGGQVLCSSNIINAVELPPKAQFKDLGLHVIKNLVEPLRIYQFLHPDLPNREFPPLQSLTNYQQSLPTYPTSFIGREKEQADLAKLLADEHCRLLTLVGPGGVGKTRLAIQLAGQQTPNFKDGVFFIPVAVPKTPDLIPTVLADTFKFTFFEQKDPLELVINYLRHKQILLIVDNFEHLIDGAETLVKIVNSAPGLKMIITSRARLNLREEWLYEVQGMPFPIEEEPPEVMEQYSAVQLFILNARRMRNGFTPTREDLHAISQICQIVDGMPLAIELATAWIRSLSCQEIAREIQRNMDFLSTTLRDIPARHRSLRAVFEHSWNLLSEEDRRIFRKLAVFRGGFTVEAATAVTHATPLTLASFVDRSLLRRNPHLRFEVAETLRHFAAQKLLENPSDYDHTRTVFSTYFADFMDRNLYLLLSADQLRSMTDISADIENIIMAWKWTIETENWPLLLRILPALMVYEDIVGHYTEVRELLAFSLDKINSTNNPQLELLKVRLKGHDGWMAFSIGDHDQGMQLMQEALDFFTKYGLTLEIGLTLYLLAKANSRLDLTQASIDQAEQSLQITQDERYKDDRIVRTLMAQTKEVLGHGLLKINQVQAAKKTLQESLQIHQQFGQRVGTIHVLEALGRVYVIEGDLPAALSSRLEALKIAREFGNQYTIARLLNNLGAVYCDMNEFDKALRSMQESVEISRKIGYRWMTAISLNNIAYLFLNNYSDTHEAIRLYTESLDLFRALEDQRGIIFTLHDLANATFAAQQFEQSRIHFLDGLNHACSLNAPDLQLYLLSSLAKLYIQIGETAYATQLCQLVVSHPESGDTARQRAQSCLDNIAQKISPSQIPALQTDPHTVPLEKIVADLLAKA